MFPPIVLMPTIKDQLMNLLSKPIIAKAKAAPKIDSSFWIFR
jgi:hypothetical protein